jgi:hypothetical protein
MHTEIRKPQQRGAKSFFHTHETSDFFGRCFWKMTTHTMLCAAAAASLREVQNSLFAHNREHRSLLFYEKIK